MDAAPDYFKRCHVSDHGLLSRKNRFPVGEVRIREFVPLEVAQLPGNRFPGELRLLFCCQVHIQGTNNRKNCAGTAGLMV